MRVLLAAPLLLMALAGCLAEDADLQEYEPPRPGPVEAQVDGWPSLADARIRPGVPVTTVFPDGGQGSCTSNFLFRTPDNKSLYIGLAAHCLGSADDPVPVGTPITVAGIQSAGEVAWNLWERDPSPQADFALIKLSGTAAVRPFVHPAVLHYGGPTALGDTTQVMPGEYVITYGHSTQRPPGDPENPREGVVASHEQRGDITVYTDHPGIRGDSGSGLMTSDGQAIGVLSRKVVTPLEDHVEERQAPTLNMYVELDTLLAEARADLGELELVTWSLLEGPAIPL